jgi:hypothetical protein
VANRNDEARRKQAFEDWKQLPQIGRSRTVNQLYDWYRDRLLANPGERPLIPTTSRGVLYGWSRDDRWEEQIVEEMEEDKAIEKQEFALFRRRALGNLYYICDDAVMALQAVVRNKNGKVSPRDQIEAAKTILDRVGLVAHVAAKTNANDKPEAVSKDQPFDNSDLPATDASEDALNVWLGQMTPGSRNT